jgi:hypothetical protein
MSYAGTGVLDQAVSIMPLVLWVTIGVALLTFVGVVMTAVVAALNLRRQLKHDCEQRDLERKMALRKEVFLKAAESIPLANSLLGRIADLNYNQKKLVTEFAQHLSTFAKLHMVGSNATVEAIFAYTDRLGSSFMEMQRVRSELTMRQHQIALAQSDSNPSRAAKLATKQRQQQIIAGERGIELSVSLAELQPMVLSSIRDEMDLPIDINRYRELLGQQFASMREAWLKSKAQFQGMIDKGLDTPTNLS